MNTVNVYKKSDGALAARKLLPDAFGRLVCLENTGTDHTGQFTCLAWNCLGEKLLASDHLGHIYLIEPSRNRFRHVVHAPRPPTSLHFCLHNKEEFLAALSDHTLRCYHLLSGQLLATLKGHQANVHSISIHSAGRYAISTDADVALLWDMHSFTRRRRLSVKEDIAVTQVLFVPGANSIVTCFRDDSIFVWDSETLCCRAQLQLPPQHPNPLYRCFAVSRDGRLLLAGGRSRYLHLWNLESLQVARVLELPGTVKQVSQVSLIERQNNRADGGADSLVVLLCRQSRAAGSRLHLVELASCRMLCELPLKHVSRFALAANDSSQIALLEDGKLHLFSLPDVYPDLNPPPSSIVRVVRESSSPTRQELISFKKENVAPNTGPLPTPGSLEPKKLRAIVREFGQFPSKYRSFIWRTVLSFPENYLAFSSLVDKGIHPAFENLGKRYPIKSSKLLRVLQRCLSALAHWSPLFGEADYLPLLAFPFVKQFENNALHAFEMLATLLTNWCANWFEFFPNPPLNILAMVENVVSYADHELYAHFCSVGCTTQIYAWPLLETAFSEVLTKAEWEALWDSLIVEHPAFLIICAAAYSLCARGPLLRVTDLDEMRSFFHHRNSVTVKELLRQARALSSRIPADRHPRKLLPELTPLTTAQYPIFQRYPKYIVNYQSRERARIRAEEAQLEEEAVKTAEAESRIRQHRAEEEAWYRQQELLLSAEESRRELIAVEEDRLKEQRRRLRALNREVKLREIHLLDAARRRFRDFQSTQKATTLQRLDDELARKSRQRIDETEAALDEAGVRHLELQLQRKLFEGELNKEATAACDVGAGFTMGSASNRDVDNLLTSDLRITEDVDRLRDPLRHLAVQEQIADEAVFARRHVDKYSSVADRQPLLTSDLSKVRTDNANLEKEINELLERLRIARHKVTSEAADLSCEALYSSLGSSSASSSSNVERGFHQDTHHNDTNDEADTSGHDLLAQVRNLRHRLNEQLL